MDRRFLVISTIEVGPGREWRVHIMISTHGTAVPWQLVKIKCAGRLRASACRTVMCRWRGTPEVAAGLADHGTLPFGWGQWGRLGRRQGLLPARPVGVEGVVQNVGREGRSAAGTRPGRCGAAIRVSAVRNRRARMPGPQVRLRRMQKVGIGSAGGGGPHGPPRLVRAVSGGRRRRARGVSAGEA